MPVLRIAAFLTPLLALACAPAGNEASAPTGSEAVADGVLRLHVRFAPPVPGAGPEPASFSATFAHASAGLVRGPLEAETTADGHGVAWSGTVGEDGVLLVLEPEHLTTRVAFAVARGSGDEAVQERILLGRTPLTETWAIPVWQPAPGRAPAAPELAIVHDRAASLVDVAVQPLQAAGDAPGTVPARVELCFAEPGYAKELDLVPLEGFGAPGALGRRYWVEAAAPFARVVARHRAEDEDVLVAAHVGGRWPDAAAVAVDGLPVEMDVCRFVLPMPPDARIGRALVEPPDEASLPPGSIAIWIAHGAERVETDPAAHGARTVEASASKASSEPAASSSTLSSPGDPER